MRSLLLVVTALAALSAGGWYVVEWMPHDGVASASASGALTAPARALHPQQVRSIRLLGDRLPLTILEAQLSVKIGDLLDDERLAADRRAVRDALVERGHWAADVSAPELLFGDDGGVHVSYRVVPGPIFHVRDVSIVGGAAPAEPLTLTTGDDVSPQRLARNAELLAAYLARHDAPGARVTVETATDRDARAVDVTFVVQRAGR